jgi:hypothetical protein
MLDLFRRSRLVAGLLGLLSPGGLGMVLPLVHPCPVDAPWLAQAQPAGTHSPHQHHAPEPGRTPNHTCVCIGSCLTGALPLQPRAHAVPMVPCRAAAPPVGADAALLLAPLATLLPPATAPPSA